MLLFFFNISHAFKHILRSIDMSKTFVPWLYFKLKQVNLCIPKEVNVKKDLLFLINSDYFVKTHSQRNDIYVMFKCYQRHQVKHYYKT